jgi:hypothetical protein
VFSNLILRARARPALLVPFAIAVSILCQPVRALHAQIVHGRVVEAEGALPIKHATIDLQDDRGQVIARVSVDTLGGFRLRSWHAGKYRLKTTAIGYQTVSSEILELATGDILDLTIRMATNAVPLEPIVVKARARATLAEIALRGYYDRRDSGQRLGLGRFLDRGAMAQRGRKLTEVLATIPGVRVHYVSNCSVPLISMTGNNAARFEQADGDRYVRAGSGTSCNASTICRANFYIDGVQHALDDGVSIDLTLPLDQVEAIEVYRRASETPAEFLGRATCGVVAIWTRRG